MRVGDPVELNWEGDSTWNPDAEAVAAKLFDAHWLIKKVESRWVAIPLKSGELTLPAIEIKDSQGKVQATTQPQTVQVESVLDSKDPQASVPIDARPPVGVEFPWLWTGSRAIGILVALVVLVWLIRKVVSRSKRQAKMPVVRDLRGNLSEDAWALQELSRIEAHKWIEQGRFKEFYFACSEVLKGYLGERFEFDARESTSSEIVQGLEARRRVTDARLDQLESLLTRLDQVKFTTWSPTEGDARDLVRDIREWIVATRRPPLPDPLIAPVTGASE